MLRLTLGGLLDVFLYIKRLEHFTGLTLQPTVLQMTHPSSAYNSLL